MSTNYMVNSLTSSTCSSLISTTAPAPLPHIQKCPSHTDTRILPSLPYPITPPTAKRQRTLIPYSPGELGKYATCQAQALERMGWSAYFKHQQHPHSLHPSLHKLPHPTAQYLSKLACAGATATFSPPWSRRQRDTAYLRAPHISASSQYKSFLTSDLFDYVRMGYWTVLPYSAI
jgi:hypothetical protein